MKKSSDRESQYKQPISTLETTFRWLDVHPGDGREGDDVAGGNHSPRDGLQRGEDQNHHPHHQKPVTKR